MIKEKQVASRLSCFFEGVLGNTNTKLSTESVTVVSNSTVTVDTDKKTVVELSTDQYTVAWLPNRLSLHFQQIPPESNLIS